MICSILINRIIYTRRITILTSLSCGSYTGTVGLLDHYTIESQQSRITRFCFIIIDTLCQCRKSRSELMCCKTRVSWRSSIDNFWTATTRSIPLIWIASNTINCLRSLPPTDHLIVVCSWVFESILILCAYTI